MQPEPIDGWQAFWQAFCLVLFVCVCVLACYDTARALFAGRPISMEDFFRFMAMAAAVAIVIGAIWTKRLNRA